MIGLLVLGFIFYMAYLETAANIENWMDRRRWEKQNWKAP